jgi:starch synthase
LFVAAECVPFVKTGGLADVVGALPKSLAQLGIDVRVILPKYKDIPEHLRYQIQHKRWIMVGLSWRQQYCGIEVLEHEGITYYFIDNEYYFKRDGIYGYGNSNDDAERFAFFCKAVLESLPHLGFEIDILHLHDWHTGLIPVYLQAHYHSDPFYQRIRTVFTIHNLRYQGIFPASIVRDMLDLGMEYMTSDRLEFHGQVNFMKGGLVFADRLTTVSQTYAQEIQTPYYGEQLDGVLRARRNVLRGITNGIDCDSYDPHTDPHLFAYAENLRDQKRANKQKLQEFLGLPIRPDVPLIAMVTRLTRQKGLDLVLYVLDEILNMGTQMILLGTGEQRYEQAFRDASYHYPNLSAQFIFDDSLSRNIYIGSDMFLMPSLFEPCGISQLIAMRYGTIPIVRETGGLIDTVQHYNEWNRNGNGFRFSTINAHDMLHAIRTALSYYEQPLEWDQIVSNAASSDYSWFRSAREYQSLYSELVN